MGTAAARYEMMATQRQTILERARDCAALTIPSLMPPTGHSATERLATPWQTMGARCVNNLASKLLLTLFPPTAPFFKFSIDGKAKQQAEARQGSPILQGQIDTALNVYERKILADIETSGMRTQLFAVTKLLVSTGNVLLNIPALGPARVFRLDRYVIRRDPMGNVLEIAIREDVAPESLPKHVRDMLGPDGGEEKVEGADRTVQLYTHICWEGDQWEIYQEIKGMDIPGSQATYPKDKCPWLALRMNAIDNEDYGRGMVEEYLGDFRSLEALSRALVQGTAAAAKVLFLVDPTGQTDFRVISKSNTGDVREGRAIDISTMKVDKGSDFNVAANQMKTIAEGLAYAFLLNSAIQRPGERVTAEEIRYMAQEIETGLGGVYSNLSQELQLPLVILIQNRLQRQGVLPTLPAGEVKPTITTGLDALGRGQERNRLLSFIKGLAEINPEFLKTLKPEEVTRRLAAADGVDLDGLIKTPQEMQAEQQQQVASQMMDKLGPNAVTQAGQMAQNVQAQQQPQPQQ